MPSAGGSAVTDEILIQGDFREKIAEILTDSAIKSKRTTSYIFPLLYRINQIVESFDTTLGLYVNNLFDEGQSCSFSPLHHEMTPKASGIFRTAH